MTEQRKNFRKYIVPAMIGNLSLFVLTIVDGMFVGDGVGTDRVRRAPEILLELCVCRLYRGYRILSVLHKANAVRDYHKCVQKHCVQFCLHQFSAAYLRL